MSTISAGTTSTTAFKVTSDTTGSLLLKTGASGATAIDIDTAQVVTIGNIAVTGGTINNTIIGSTTAAAGTFTTLTAASTVTFNGGTANGVAYLNGSKNLTTGSALTFDGTNLTVGSGTASGQIHVFGTSFALMRLSAASNNVAGVDFGTSASPDIARIRYDNTNNSFAFRTNGTDALWINSSQNVGIGTSSPASKLTVSGDVHILSTNYLNFTNTAQQTYLRAPASNTIAFGTSNTEQMRLDSSGNLGIGTTSPAARLHLSATEAVIRMTATSGRIWDVISGGGGNVGANFFAIRDTTSGANVVQIAPQASEALRIDASGNVGIGTTSPSDILTLAGGASGSYGLTINNAKVGGGTKAIFQYDATNQIALVGGNTTNGLAFQTLTSGSLTTKAVIDSSGNLGIGTTSPAEALEISRTTDPKIRFVDVGNLDAKIGIVASTALGFEVNGSERARISSGGDFGINTSSPGNKLQVVAASATSSADVINIDGGSAGFSGANDAGTSYSLIFNACAYSIASGVVQRTGAAISMAKEYSWNQAVAAQGTKGALVFKTNSGDIATPALTERARITSNGQIITAYDGGKYTQRGIVLLGSAFDNPVQSIITLPASGSTNTVISIKVTCNQNAYATAAANQHIGNARAMWDGSAWVKEVDTMTVVCGDIATVGTLAWSGSTLQYTTNRVSNYDGYLVTYEVLYNPTGTTLTYAF